MDLESVKALNITGLSEEDAKKIADASTEELKGYVTKDKYNELNTTVKTLQGTVKERDTQLETLKGQVGDNTALKTQIETLQADNKKAKEKYEADIKALKIDGAIKLALNGKAQDVDIVAGLINKDNLVIGEDGKIIGLDEQVKGLQESKAFLFKQEEAPGADGKPFVKGGTGSEPQGGSEPKTLKGSIAAALGLNK